MRKIINIPNTTFCNLCGCYFSYEDEDVTEFDERTIGNGHSLFWLVKCPDCENELLVVPDSCASRADRRRLEILGITWESEV